MKYTSLNRRPLRPRHLILVDAENLAGCGVPSPADAAGSRKALMAVIPDLDAAFVVVACNHLAAPAVAWHWRQARNLWRSGPDGADLALLQVLEHEGVERRFDRVTICSGDHIFAGAVATLASQGIRTTVVGLKGHISLSLRMAAHSTVELPPPAGAEPPVAA
jgi:hypothetical protein